MRMFILLDVEDNESIPSYVVPEFRQTVNRLYSMTAELSVENHFSVYLWSCARRLTATAFSIPFGPG
jgi:hypothetical protein